MKIESETSCVDQSGSSGPGREAKTTDNKSPSTVGGTVEFTRVSKMKEPEKENISKRVPPLILFISPKKAEQSLSQKKRKVLNLSPSSPTNNIDSLVVESTENTSSDLVNSFHLSSPEFKCNDCPSAFSTKQEYFEEHFNGEIKNKDREKVIKCNLSGGGLKKSFIFSYDQLSVLRSNYIVNKYPSKEELMKIADNIGHPYRSVLNWFNNSRAKDKRQQKEDMRNEEHEAEDKDVIVIGEVKNEEVSKGKGNMSDVGNPNQPPSGKSVTVTSQSELNYDSFSDLRALLDSDLD